MKALLAVVGMVALVVGTSPVLAQTPTAPTTDQKTWQKIHGTAQSISGSTLTLKADDGRTLTVDMSQVSQNVQHAITQGEGVEVEGHYGADQTHVTARYIQQDSSNPARGGHVAGKTAGAGTTTSTTDQKGWERIHGTVQSISGTTLTLKTDDNRTLTVDMAKVSQNVQHGITQGEGVTVIGHMASDKDHVTAQYIQQDRAAGSASPSTTPKKK